MTSKGAKFNVPGDSIACPFIGDSEHRKEYIERQGQQWLCLLSYVSLDEWFSVDMVISPPSDIASAALEMRFITDFEKCTGEPGINI